MVQRQSTLAKANEKGRVSSTLFNVVTPTKERVLYAEDCVLLSVGFWNGVFTALVYWVSPWFLIGHCWITFMLMQSVFTGICPIEWFVMKLFNLPRARNGSCCGGAPVPGANKTKVAPTPAPASVDTAETPADKYITVKDAWSSDPPVQQQPAPAIVE